MHILLVEDNPLDVILIRKYLSDSTIHDCPTLKDMRESIQLSDYDMILLDLTLPDSREIETFKTAYDIAKDTPIIVLTGHNDENTALQCVRLGAQDYVVKQIGLEDQLKRAILYAMERQKNRIAYTEITKKRAKN